MSTLTIKNVGKTYPNGKKAIQHANIDINSGEFVVFVGPSGCGKSTLLRMIAGLESITEGEMFLDDKKINDIEPADRDIAMVFQNYALYPHMTVFKNLAYGLINRKYAKADIEKRVNETAEMLQIKDYLKNKPSELSGGQRQRVAMGRAIVREPKLFLFDEPLSNLDAKLRNTMRLEIKSLQKRLDTTAVYVTHDQVEAMTMADKIVILSAGKVEQVGTPQQIYHQPANLFVATFMGSPAMNILDASYENGQLAFDGETKIDLPQHIQLANSANINTKIKVGIRPESVAIHKEHTENGLPVHVNIIEDLGAQRIVHGEFGGQSITVNTMQTNIQANETNYIDLPANLLYLFDADTGQNLLLNQ